MMELWEKLIFSKSSHSPCHPPCPRLPSSPRHPLPPPTDFVFLGVLSIFVYYSATKVVKPVLEVVLGPDLWYDLLKVGTLC